MQLLQVNQSPKSVLVTKMAVFVVILEPQPHFCFNVIINYSPNAHNNASACLKYRRFGRKPSKLWSVLPNGEDV